MQRSHVRTVPAAVVYLLVVSFVLPESGRMMCLVLVVVVEISGVTQPMALVLRLHTYISCPLTILREVFGTKPIVTLGACQE